MHIYNVIFVHLIRHCPFYVVTVKAIVISYTLCFMDLDKLTLAQLCYGGLVLGLRHILEIPKLPQKRMLTAKVVKSDSKIIISPPWSKSVRDTLCSRFSIYFSCVRSNVVPKL